MEFSSNTWFVTRSEKSKMISSCHVIIVLSPCGVFIWYAVRTRELSSLVHGLHLISP